MYLCKCKMIALRPLVWPLEQVYRRTYWRNLPAAEICASLTGVPAAHWQFDNEPACIDLIYRNFDSWLAVQEVALFYLLLVFTALQLYSCVKLILQLVGRKIFGVT